jgi:zinc transport system ATP-binding protein
MANSAEGMERSREIVVQFDSVSFAYGNVPVLKNVSFHIHRGEFAALVGPNGSGKTTVLKLILGLEAPTAGQVALFGAAKGVSRNVAKDTANNAAWRDRLGYVPQHHPADKLFPISVRDVVRMGLLRPSRGYSAAGKAAVDNAMEQADISDLAARQWRALSGGQQRRALVARALAAQPELLVLDEPTANMDAESEARFFETLGKLKGNATILIVTHDMNFVSILTDRVLCLGDNALHRYGIVQHRTETDNASQVRVLHGENIPANDCCE